MALWALDLYLRDELPDDVAERWRAGDVPPEVLEFINRSGQAWRALAEQAGRAGNGAATN